MNETDKKRLHFGVVFPSLDNTHKYGLLAGIYEYAMRNDIHLTAYFGTYGQDNYDYASHYEPCFHAIDNSTILDGVILFSGFIAHNIGVDLFIKYVKSIPRSIPVVSIGMTIDGVYSVMVDSKAGMYNAIEHLIHCHNKKQIAIVTGPKGHQEADARLEGYKQALRDNGLPVDDNLILPGTFTPMSGREAAIELTERRNVPYDAVAACDDEAALGVMNILAQKGKKIPEEISVSGFDDVEDAAAHDPPLSTVRQDFSGMAQTAGEMLSSIAAGEKIDAVRNIIPDFIIRRSCGCEGNEQDTLKYKPESREIKLRRRRITDNLLLNFNLESLTQTLQKSLPFISINTVLVGLYDEPIAIGEHDRNRNITRIFGFDDEQDFFIHLSGEDTLPFSNYNLIENFDFDRGRRVLFFLPLYFVEEESGIALIAYNDMNPVDSYETLRRNVATAVKGASLLEKIQLLSITDELTGLLNRRGFFKFVYSRISYLQREPASLPIVLAIDMDGLKHINDTYGHAEGDSAISTFARLLRDVTREGDVVGRIGGDEFVVFSVVKSESNIAALEDRIRAKFLDYNAAGHRPYPIMGSIGTCVVEELTNEGFDHAMLGADDALYEEKAQKKAQGLTRQ